MTEPAEIARGLTKTQRETLEKLAAASKAQTAAALRISGQSADQLDAKGLAVNVYLYEGALSRWLISDLGRAVAAALAGARNG